MGKILSQVGQSRVDRDLVFPLELGPHLAKFRIGTRRRHYVIHDVNVYIVQNYDASVRSSS